MEFNPDISVSRPLSPIPIHQPIDTEGDDYCSSSAGTFNASEAQRLLANTIQPPSMTNFRPVVNMAPPGPVHPNVLQSSSLIRDPDPIQNSNLNGIKDNVELRSASPGIDNFMLPGFFHPPPNCSNSESKQDLLRTNSASWIGLDEDIDPLWDEHQQRIDKSTMEKQNIETFSNVTKITDRVRAAGDKLLRKDLICTLCEPYRAFKSANGFTLHARSKHNCRDLGHVFECMLTMNKTGPYKIQTDNDNLIISHTAPIKNRRKNTETSRARPRKLIQPTPLVIVETSSSTIDNTPIKKAVKPEKGKKKAKSAALTRQLRLEKNRENSKRLRKVKKLQLEQLKQRVQELQAEVVALRLQLSKDVHADEDNEIVEDLVCTSGIHKKVTKRRIKEIETTRQAYSINTTMAFQQQSIENLSHRIKMAFLKEEENKRTGNNLGLANFPTVLEHMDDSLREVNKATTSYCSRRLELVEHRMSALFESIMPSKAENIASYLLHPEGVLPENADDYNGWFMNILKGKHGSIRLDVMKSILNTEKHQIDEILKQKELIKETIEGEQELIDHLCCVLPLFWKQAERRENLSKTISSIFSTHQKAKFFIESQNIDVDSSIALEYLQGIDVAKQKVRGKLQDTIGLKTRFMEEHKKKQYCETRRGPKKRKFPL